MKKTHLLVLILLVTLPLAACQPAQPAPEDGTLKVLAVESFLADLTRQVAGERLTVDTLIPAGLDPHAFEPAPQDVARIASSQVLVVNGAGLEEWLDEVLQNAGGERLVIEASAGVPVRVTSADEAGAHAGEVDPHLWLDPQNAALYVENIRDGLIRADPQGEAVYAQNAAAYLDQLAGLDAWIQAQVAQIPPERRLLVTNHESFGYFATRYGFTLVGAVIPSASSSASPSAQQLAGLVDQIRQSGAPAIFLETGTNSQLAEQVARETGAKVVTGLFTHSITEPGGPAPSYLAMMRYNVTAIVEALK